MLNPPVRNGRRGDALRPDRREENKETIMIRHVCQVVLGGIVLAATLAWSSSPSQAISCIGAGDVTSLPGGGCDLGPLRFDQFALSVQGQNGFNAAIFIGGAPFTNVSAEQTSGGQATLGFQVAHQPAPMDGLGDILLSYRASTLSGGILLGGINLANGGVGPVTIHERVCGTNFTATGACTTLLLADLLVTSNTFADVRFQPDVDVHEIFVLKDILIGNGGFISDFSNSHELGAAPEPATMLLLGSTFAGLGAYARRKRTLDATAGLS
jgi:hypothetical protein